MGKSDNTRIEALDALLAEKRKHEGYLAKLEEKRESTPEHVFTRLRDEYLTKLTDLQVRAAAEAEALTESLKEDEAAVAEIEGRLAAVTEERVEGELRAAVGEYDPKEWAKKLETLTASAAKIEKEREVRVASFERTRGLLIEAKGAEAVAALSATSAPPVSPAAPSPRQPTPAAAPVVTRVPTPAASAPAAPAVPPPRATPTSAPAATVPPAPPAAKATPAKGTPMKEGPSFDELAFLNSVVGRSSVPLKVEGAPPPPRPSRPVAEVKDAGASAARSSVAPQVPPSPAPAPSAAKPAPAAQEDDEDSPPSALGKPTPRSSQAIKTLKCQECGTLNYPTEWYCERCGGELAAL